MDFRYFFDVSEILVLSCLFSRNSWAKIEEPSEDDGNVSCNKQECKVLMDLLSG